MSFHERTFFRNGPRHRADASSSSGAIRRQFDFRSIEIGRWVTNEERDRAAALFHDALCDLMLILQGTETLISLRGTLALQYGTGGRPGVSAHYDPSQRSFALAKNAGPGSIAHEWFHAFDHYIAPKCFQAAPPQRLCIRRLVSRCHAHSPPSQPTIDRLLSGHLASIGRPEA